MNLPPLEYGRLKEIVAEGGKARMRNSRGWFVGPIAGGLDVAEVHHTASQDATTQEGYARLFAAAPELLAALEEVTPELYGCNSRGKRHTFITDPNCEGCQAAERHRALIRKARGQSENPTPPKDSRTDSGK